MQKSDIELSGFQFPSSVREDGASVEIVQLDSARSNATRDLENWISENSLTEPESTWRVISHAKTKEESMFLILSQKKFLRTRYRLLSGRLIRSQEEILEPEVGEIHLRRSGLLELYSVPAKQRKGALTSLAEFFGGEDNKDILSPLSLPKDAMLALMKEAAEVSSVSLTGIGNPFFSDITLSGQDPANSRTFKELLPSGTIRSFRAKFQVGSDGEQALMLASVSNNCKVRFYGGREPVAQSDIEDYLSRVRKSAVTAEVLKE